jgi:hypothetical protein
MRIAIDSYLNMDEFNEQWDVSEATGTNISTIMASIGFRTKAIHDIDDGMKLVTVIPGSVKQATSTDYAISNYPASAKTARDRLNATLSRLEREARILTKIKHVSGHWMCAHGGFVGAGDGAASIEEWYTVYRKYSSDNYKIVAIVDGNDTETMELLGEYFGKILSGHTANKCLEMLNRHNTSGDVHYDARSVEKRPNITSPDDGWKLREFEGKRWNLLT